MKDAISKIPAKWQKIIVIGLVALVALTFVKDALIKTVVTTVGSSVVGAPIKIGHFSLGLLTQKVLIKNYKLYNPPGYPNEPMVDVPEVRVNYDLGALLTGKLHFPLVVFSLKEMVVVKDKDGKLNVDSLKVIEDQKVAKDKKPAKEMALKIDELRLNVERVVLKDLSKDPVTVQVFEVALKDKVFKNLTSAQQMATLIMVQAMGPTAIKSAGVYAAATVLGVGFLPAGVIGALVGNDSASAEFSQNINKVYDVALKLMKEIGEVKSEDKAAGAIKGKVDGVDITLKVETTADKKTKATASARQLMIPKPEFSGGVIYQLKEKL